MLIRCSKCEIERQINMRRISPRRRLPQLLRLLLFIGISSTTADPVANYTLGESNRAQSLSTSISSPWPPPSSSTRVRNIKGAVPPKTKSTGDVTSRLLVADGDTDATADILEEIGKKSGLDFRDSRDFKADAYFRDSDFKAGEESEFSKLTKGNSYEFNLAESQKINRRNFNETSTNETRRKRDNWYLTAAPNFWSYQPQGYLYYGFGIPMVLIQWPSRIQSPHQVHSRLPKQKPDANDNSMIKSGVDFNDFNYEDDKNFKGKGKFGGMHDYEDDDEHDEYDEHIHVDEEDYDEDDVVKNEEPVKIKTGVYSGSGKWRPIFSNKKPGSDVHKDTDVKKPLPYSPTPKKRKPLEHWLQHVFPPWPKNKTVISRN